MIARDAAATIERSLLSVHETSGAPVLLVDDGSRDDTVARAEAVMGARLTVVRAPAPHGTGPARQCALDHLTTPYGLWLDADDVMLPGRARAVLTALHAGADLVYEPCLLRPAAGMSQAPDKRADIPDFLKSPGGVWRSFERNWLPALSGGFRRDFARMIGYDPAFRAAEDYDFLLRALMAGAQVAFTAAPLLVYYDSPASLSRRLTLSERFSRRAHRKHRSRSAITVLERHCAGYSEGWLTLAQHALASGAPAAALGYLRRPVADEKAPINPYGRPAGAVRTFLASLCHLQRKETDMAENYLQQSLDCAPAAEALNNLAVLAAQRGDRARALPLLDTALQMTPDYFDAAYNRDRLGQPAALRLTFTLLRVGPGRNRYTGGTAEVGRG